MRFTPLLSLVVLFTGSMAQAEDAKALAEKLTTEGAANFSARKAQVLADSYTDEAKVYLVSLDESTGRAKEEVREGRAEIRTMYEDMFKDDGAIDAHNEVNYARLIGSNFLMIAGTFEIRIGADVTRVAFVQLRVKQDEALADREPAARVRFEFVRGPADQPISTRCLS